MQTFTCALLVVFSLTAFLNWNSKDKALLSKSQKITLWTCEVSLYLVQVGVLCGGIFILVRLYKL